MSEERPALKCEITSCPSYNDYANGCRLSQYPDKDSRHRIPEECSHRKFINTFKNP